ncbi:MAG: transmembrane 220 family protein [Cyclobacteriaceae bacterium]|nr:transmembrane 220 family protein [Cyclobacteriaceae bacterium]
MSTSSSRFLKFWCYTWIGLFILFALLQLNDPDPEIWMTFYFLAAAIHFAFLYLKLPVLIIIIYALLAFSWSFLQLPETFEGFAQKETHNMNVEEARESAGLLLTGLVTLLTLLIYKKQS